MSAGTIGKAYIQILPSANGISGKIQTALSKDAPALKEKGGGLGSIIGDSLRFNFLNIAQGAFGQFKDFVGNVLGEAKELQQNVGGTQAVFGTHAESVRKIAKKAYEEMGLSASDYMATINKMGSLLQGSGIEQAKSFNLASEAMQRAADVASVMGVSQQVAMESIAGAAKGNFTMMDNIGVKMNATAIQAYALEKGVNFKWNTATEAEKIELALQLFMDRTKQFAGNFKKEVGDTYSGSLDALRASWKNLIGSLGNGEEVGEKSRILVKSAFNYAKNLGVFLKNIFNGLAEALPALWSEIVNSIPNFVGNLKDKLTNELPKLFPSVYNWLGDLVGNLRKWASEKLPVILADLNEFLFKLVDNVKEFMINGDGASKIGDIFGDLGVFVIEGLSNLVLFLGNYLAELLQRAPAFIETQITILGNFVSKIIGFIFSEKFGKIILKLGLVLGKIVLMLPKFLLDLSVALVKGLGNVLVSLLGAIANGLSPLFSAGANMLKAIWNGFSSLVGGLLSFFGNLVVKIYNAIISGVTKLYNAGVALIKGLWNGIASSIGWLFDKVNNFCSDLWGTVTSFFGINSPSKLMMTAGVALGEGLAIGIDSQVNTVKKAMDNVQAEANRDFNSSLKIGVATDNKNLKNSLYEQKGKHARNGSAYEININNAEIHDKRDIRKISTEIAEELERS